MQVLISLLAFAVAIGILVTVHEFGHFWVARRLGIRVLRFSIGFGKVVWSRTGRDGTEYALSAVPFGGYVKMLDEREGEVAEKDLPEAFNRQHIAKRIAVVLAGPLFNILFAIVAYWGVYMIGVPGVKPVIGSVDSGSYAAQAGFHEQDLIVSVGGEKTPTWESATLELLDGLLDGGTVSVTVESESGARRGLQLEAPVTPALTAPGALLDGLGLHPWNPSLPPVLGRVADDGPAGKAGLEVGDRIVAVDGRAVSDWDQWRNYVRAHPGATLQVDIVRNGVRRTIALPLATHAEGETRIGYSGTAPDVPEALISRLRAEQRYGVVESAIHGVGKTWQVSALTLRMLGHMITGQVSLKNISGPINIAQYAGYTAQVGVVPFLSFLAVVSISLAILNLLPVPVLDGGHLIFYLV
ncbi:MAG: RIP metalloprotease RseP, partial [Gammaproteobacteria bacterium]